MGLVKASGTDGLPPAAVAIQDVAALAIDLAAPEAALRRAAARALAAHPEAAMTICDRLDVETSLSVRAVLLTTAIHFQSPDVARRLAGFLRSDDTALRNAAIEALQEMPDAAADPVQALLSDPDSDVRIFAVNILATLRNAAVPAWLAAVVRCDPHVNVCAAAVDGLAEVGGPEVLDALDDLNQRFAGNAFMAFVIDAAIRRIRGTS